MLKAAIKIKSYYKMVLIYRKFMNIKKLEKLYPSIKWNGNADIVEVIGSFTEPPWEVKTKLDYCKLRGIFIKYLMIAKFEDEYEYSFVINGITGYKIHKVFIKHNKKTFGRVFTCNNFKDKDNEEHKVSNKKEFIKEASLPNLITTKMNTKYDMAGFPMLNDCFEIPKKSYHNISDSLISPRTDKGTLERDMKTLEFAFGNVIKRIEPCKLLLDNTSKEIVDEYKLPIDHNFGLSGDIGSGN